MKIKSLASYKFLVLAILLFAVVPVPRSLAEVALHANDLPTLTLDTHFPRCTYRELEDIGFPDHMHFWHWDGWKPGSQGEEIMMGPGFLCFRNEILPREGLIVEEDAVRYGNFVIHHNPAYDASHILYYLELFDWAGLTVPELLGFTLQDTLQIYTPDNLEIYKEKTGYEVWRLFKLDGDSCIPEPLPVLQARTLDGHAIFAMVTEWVLAESIDIELPNWLRVGLPEYISESGVHLSNYMMQYRSAGPILFSPPLIDSILGSAPNPDPGKDRELYRRASYSAFLMVWELVENQGGLEAMRDFLGHLSGGMSLDEASLLVYGMNMDDLSESLDPTVLGEPLGKSVQGRRPHLPPD